MHVFYGIRGENYTVKVTKIGGKKATNAMDLQRSVVKLQHYSRRSEVVESTVY